MRQTGQWMVMAFLGLWAMFSALGGALPSQSGRQTSSSSPGQGKEQQPEETKNQEKKQDGTSQQSAASPKSVLKKPIQLLLEVLEPEAPEPITQEQTTTEEAWEEAAFVRLKKHADRLSFVIALVPDPKDSHLSLNFDQTLNAIQGAYATEGYRQDRFYLPWSEPVEEGVAPKYRETPGLMIFRTAALAEATETPGGNASARIEAVFLVGETPKLGIHRKVFRETLRLIDAVQQASPKPLRLLGPSFSGSADSLQSALLSKKEAKDQVRIVTGTATAPEVEGLGKDFNFSRSVLSDTELQKTSFDFFEASLGWDIDKVALLVESDTAYGQTFPGPQLTKISFPSGLSRVRTAWEKYKEEDQGKEEEDQQKQVRPALGISLADGGLADLVPEFSELTVSSKDLALSNLLSTISREGFQYVGIVATDTRDKLFLAQKLREFCPDVILFSVENHLLYAHPEEGAALNGTLVLTSYPLFTEGTEWIPGGIWEDRPYRRQHISDFGQGIFLAAQQLIRENDPDPSKTLRIAPAAWIAAVGNGSLWPIARRFPTAETPAALAEQVLEHKPKVPRGFDGLGERTELQLIVCALMISLLAWFLWNRAEPLELQASRHLLLLGLGVLWLASAILLLFGTLPLWRSLYGPPGTAAYSASSTIFCCWRPPLPACSGW